MRQILDGGDELWPIKTRHRHVGNHQVDTPLLETFQRLFATGATGDAVTAGLQHDFAIRKGLFIVINTKNRALGFHSPSVSATPAVRRSRTEISLFAKNRKAK